MSLLLSFSTPLPNTKITKNNYPSSALPLSKKINPPLLEKNTLTLHPNHLKANYLKFGHIPLS
jgi:hypothetical protein